MGLLRCYNFSAYDMATKFGWVNGKPGMGAVEPVSAGLGTLSSGLAEARDRSGQTVDQLEVDWRGPASDAARTSLTSTAQGIDGTATVTENASARLVDYGHSFEAMRRQISYVNPDDYGWWQKAGDWGSELWSTIRGQGTDHVTIAERNQANDEVANRALQAHSVETSAVDDRFTTATAPPPPAPGPPPGDGGGGMSSVGGVPTGSMPSPHPDTVGAAQITGPGPGAPGPVPAGPAGPATPGPGAPAGPPGGAVPVPTAPPGGPVPGRPGPDAGGGGAARPGPGAVDPPTTSARTPAPGSPGPAALPGGGAEGGGRGTGGTGGPGDRAPGPGTPLPGRTPDRLDRGARFGNGARDHQIYRPSPNSPSTGGPGPGRLPGPGSRLGGSGYGGYGGSGYAGSGYGGSSYGGAGGTSAGGTGAGGTGAGYGRIGAGPGAGTDPHAGGGRGTGGPGGWGSESRTPAGGRSTPPGAETWSTTRAADRTGTPGYGPMMGAAGGLRDNQDHRNRYVVPTGEAFDVRIDAVDPVLGPEEDEQR